MPSKTDARLSLVKITDDDILKTIVKLDPNNAHGHDKVSIRIIKICSTPICKQLRLIFNHWIDNGIYACEWKKDNVVQIHKIVGKKTLKNYHPVLAIKFYYQIIKKSLHKSQF